MRNLLLAASAIAAASLFASAASAQDWSGFYVGGQVGYAWGDGEQPYTTTPGGPFTLAQDDVNLDGIVAGGRVGFNWQAGSWVFGAEGDLEWTDQSGDDGGSGGDVNGIDINSQWSIRGRAGYLFTPDTLIYATAGWTAMDVDASAPVDGDVNETIDGFTYGVGVEHKMGENWSGTLEYRHSDMDETRFRFPTDGYEEGISTDMDTVRIGVNFQFGGS
jgi:outer membrane immunogenic protein